MVVLGVVLVIKGRLVPVDVNVDVGNGDGVINGTGKVECDVRSFNSWSWDVVGVILVEGESTSIIITLSVDDISGSLEVGDFAHHKLFDEVGLGEVVWVEEWDLDTGFEDGHVVCFS